MLINCNCEVIEDEEDCDSVRFGDSGDCDFLCRHGKDRLQSLTKKLTSLSLKID